MRKPLLIALMLGIAALAAPASLWLTSGSAGAITTVADIASAGPLTHIYIGSDFSCQVAHTGDANFEMFPPGSQQGDCTTVLLVNGTTYGYSGFAGTDYTPVSQSAVTGTGTSIAPFTVTTIGDAGLTGVRLTETDSYVIGNEFYQTDIQVSNTNNTPVVVRIYRGADCYLGGSDSGFGFVDTVGKSVACTQHANNSPSGRVEEWTPITPADHYYEAGYSNVESAAGAGTELPDTCDCALSEDNGAAISWNRTIAAGASSTVSHFTTFSPTGIGAPTATPSGPTSTPSTTSATSTETPRIKTHTPTPVDTAVATNTPLPVTNTPILPATQAPPAPTQPNGNAGGIVRGPDTGTGSSAGGGHGSLILILATLALVAGMGVSAFAIKTRR